MSLYNVGADKIDYVKWPPWVYYFMVHSCGHRNQHVVNFEIPPFYCIRSVVQMSFGIGSGYFPAYISNDKFTAILDSNTPPEMSLWEKIKEFFFSTHQAEAQDCLYRLCHPSAGTTPDDVGALFERLEELAYPGYADNIKDYRLGGKYFCIMDNNGDELLSVIFANDYTVTTGHRVAFFADGFARSYPLYPQFPFHRGVL